MTSEQIDDRIKFYQVQLKTLEQRHQITVSDYQNIISNNQNRFQQIKGAMEELEWLKANSNGAKE